MSDKNFYDIEYSCGCKHEIEAKVGLHEATGNNKECTIHKGK